MGLESITDTNGPLGGLKWFAFFGASFVPSLFLAGYFLGGYYPGLAVGAPQEPNWWPTAMQVPRVACPPASSWFPAALHRNFCGDFWKDTAAPQSAEKGQVAASIQAAGWLRVGAAEWMRVGCAATCAWNGPGVGARVQCIESDCLTGLLAFSAAARGGGGLVEAGGEGDGSL